MLIWFCFLIDLLHISQSTTEAEKINRQNVPLSRVEYYFSFLQKHCQIFKEENNNYENNVSFLESKFVLEID